MEFQKLFSGECIKSTNVSQELLLCKSGVVTAEITFKRPTNSFGSEDSWRLVSRRFRRFRRFYLWLLSSWVICAPKVIWQWGLVTTCFTQISQISQILFMIAVVMSHMCPKSYFTGDNSQGTNDSWLLDLLTSRPLDFLTSWPLDLLTSWPLDLSTSWPLDFFLDR